MVHPLVPVFLLKKLRKFHISTFIFICKGKCYKTFCLFTLFKDYTSKVISLSLSLQSRLIFVENQVSLYLFLLLYFKLVSLNFYVKFSFHISNQFFLFTTKQFLYLRKPLLPDIFHLSDTLFVSLSLSLSIFCSFGLSFAWCRDHISDFPLSATG